MEKYGKPQRKMNDHHNIENAKIVCPYCGKTNEINFYSDGERRLYFTADNQICLEHIIDCLYCRTLFKWRKIGIISSFQEDVTIVESREKRFPSLYK